MLTEKEIEFIVKNEGTDPTRLLLGASKYPDIDVGLCVSCIESRRKLKTKLPLWYSNPSLLYPFPLSAEQCSSQATGEFKREIISGILSGSIGVTGADLTGGMGVDSFFLSQLCQNGGCFHYFERNSTLCKATEYNFSKLGKRGVEFHNLEIGSGIISELPGAPFDFIFIDPARRSRSDKSTKVISLDDYEPDITGLKGELFKISPIIMAKVSPMADIRLNLKLLPETRQIYVVSVDNECKELLFLLESPKAEILPDVAITAVNIKTKGGSRESFSFTLQEEENAEVKYASEVGQYLYEPNRSILKSGAFRLISSRFNLLKLASSTHLYTSGSLREDFPGKCYRICDCIDFNKKSIKKLAAEYPNADITARNFPIDTNALKKMSGIKDGGNKHLFATTLESGKKVIIIADN